MRAFGIKYLVQKGEALLLLLLCTAAAVPCAALLAGQTEAHRVESRVMHVRRTVVKSAAVAVSV